MLLFCFAYLQLPPNQTAGGLECYRGLHWMYVISGSTLFVAYVVLSIRLMWAGGELPTASTPPRAVV